MADINWVNDSGTTYTFELTGLTAAGSQAAAHDENDGTFWAQNGSGFPASWVYGHLLFKATFSKPITISRLKVVHAEGAYFTMEGGASQDWTLQYYTTGWNTQDSGTARTNYNTPLTNDHTGLTIANVTAVQFHSNIAWVNYHFPPYVPGAAWQYLYDLYAYGPLGGGESSNGIFFGSDF
jgi:hypothetical protein